MRERREAWHDRLRDVPPGRLVVIDESAASTNMARLRGRCGRHERLVAAVPHGHWKVLTVIAAMTVRGVLAAVTVDAATDGDIFLHFVTEALVPALRPGDVVVLDDLQAHKVRGVREAVEAAGATLLYLPPYSPVLAHRADVVEGQAAPADGRGTHRGRPAGGGDRRTPVHHLGRLRRILPTLRLHATGLTKVL